MYIINYFNVCGHFGRTKNVIKKLGIVLFVLFPYIYVLNISLRDKHFTDILSVTILTVLVLLLDVKKIRLCNHDLLWLGPIGTILSSAIRLNPSAITYGILFTLGIISVVLLRDKYCELELGMNIMQLLSALTAVTVIINKMIPDFWVNLVGGYYNADSLDRMTRDILGYCNGIFFSVACTAGFLVNGLAVALYNRKKRDIVMLPLLFLGIVFTNKRAHLLFAVTAFLIVKFLEGRQFKKLIYVIVAVFSLFVFVEMFISLYEANIISNTSIRIVDTVYLLLKNHDLILIWGERWNKCEKAIELYRQHKLFGIGWFRYVEYDSNNDATHNIYLQLLCETGIVGLILFIIPILTGYVKTIILLCHAKNVQVKRYLRISLYMQTFFIIYGFTGNPLYDHNFLFAYYWAIAIYEMSAFKINTVKKEITLPCRINNSCI